MAAEKTGTSRVVKVAAGVENTEQPASTRDDRHAALGVLIGKWINTGQTVGTADSPSMPIIASDTYEWVPGGFFVVHHAFGRIGNTDVGGIEIIGVDDDVYYSVFYDSFGNAHRSRIEIDDQEIYWIGDLTRCTVTMEDNGTTQLARHEVSDDDGKTWRSSMDVTLRKVA